MKVSTFGFEMSIINFSVMIYWASDNFISSTTYLELRR